MFNAAWLPIAVDSVLPCLLLRDQLTIPHLVAPFAFEHCFELEIFDRWRTSSFLR